MALEIYFRKFKYRQYLKNIEDFAQGYDPDGQGGRRRQTQSLTIAPRHQMRWKKNQEKMRKKLKKSRKNEKKNRR